MTKTKPGLQVVDHLQAQRCEKAGTSSPSDYNELCQPFLYSGPGTFIRDEVQFAFQKAGMRNPIVKAMWFCLLAYFLAQEALGQVGDDGRKYYFSSYSKWCERMACSVGTIRNIVGEMESRQLVISRNDMNKRRGDQTKWYAINHETLWTEYLQPCQSLAYQLPKSSIPTAKAWQGQLSKFGRPLPEIPTEIPPQNDSKNGGGGLIERVIDYLKSVGIRSPKARMDMAEQLARDGLKLEEVKDLIDDLVDGLKDDQELGLVVARVKAGDYDQPGQGSEETPGPPEYSDWIRDGITYGRVSPNNVPSRAEYYEQKLWKNGKGE